MNSRTGLFCCHIHGFYCIQILFHCIFSAEVNRQQEVKRGFFMLPEVMTAEAMSISLLPAPLQTEKVFCT